MVARDRSTLAQRSKVRGRPFKLGNPGRPAGSKNKTTRLVEQLVDNDAAKLTQKMIQLALAGSVPCLQYCLDRLLPKRSGRPLDLQLPAINSANDLMAAMSAVTTAVNNGDLTVEEAADLGQWLEGHAKILTVHNLAVRLEALEMQMKERGYDLTPSKNIAKFGTYKG
jgi:hypothetical protein